MLDLEREFLPAHYYQPVRHYNFKPSGWALEHIQWLAFAQQHSFSFSLSTSPQHPTMPLRTIKQWCLSSWLQAWTLQCRSQHVFYCFHFLNYLIWSCIFLIQAIAKPVITGEVSQHVSLQWRQKQDIGCTRNPDQRRDCNIIFRFCQCTLWQPPPSLTSSCRWQVSDLFEISYFSSHTLQLKVVPSISK